VTSPPPDPFGPMHAGAVTMLECFRSYRRAGAGWLEAAFILGGVLACAAAAGQIQEPGQEAGSG
jgi:hypothetical protein